MNKNKNKKNKAVTKSKKKTRKVYKDPYTFDPVNEWIWREFESSKTADPVKFIRKYIGRLFLVSTDSQTYAKSGTCVFTSIIIAYDWDKETQTGHGAAAIRFTDKRAIVPKERLSSKLMAETQRSIEVCKIVEEQLIELSDEEKDYMCDLVGVHIDCNYDEALGKSARYKDMCVGMVSAYGWKAFIKPDSWAASSVADHKC